MSRQQRTHAAAQLKAQQQYAKREQNMLRSSLGTTDSWGSLNTAGMGSAGAKTARDMNRNLSLLQNNPQAYNRKAASAYADNVRQANREAQEIKDYERQMRQANLQAVQGRGGGRSNGFGGGGIAAIRGSQSQGGLGGTAGGGGTPRVSGIPIPGTANYRSAFNKSNPFG